jgi:hypothetical protein
MSVWLERFVLTLLAALLGATVLNNPWQLDRVQQLTLIVAIIALSVFAGRTVERLRQAAPAAIVPTSESPLNATSDSPMVAPPRAPDVSSGLAINAPVQGPLVISQNQSGGQVAATINNYGPPKRTISDTVKTSMLAVLRPAAPACVAFASTQGDLEAHEFKLQLMSVFREAGWEVRDKQTFMFFGARTGLVVTIPLNAPETGLPQVIMHALSQVGNPLSGSPLRIDNEFNLK